MHTSLLQRCAPPTSFTRHGQCSASSPSARTGPTARRSRSVCAVPPSTFEPHMDSNVLASQLLVLAVTCGGALYWWLEVVPNARRRLAKEKRQGDVKAMLEDIQQQPDKRRLERWFYSDWLRQLEQRQQMAQRAAQRRVEADAVTPRSASKGSSESELVGKQGPVADQGEGPGTTAEGRASAASGDKHSSDTGVDSNRSLQQDDAAYDDDRMPCFWSLDNPIIAVGALLGFAVIRTVVFHQGSS